MSVFKCPYCGSSEILEDFNGQALRCAQCDECGVEEDFVSRSKKSDKIRRVKRFDDELELPIEEMTEDIIESEDNFDDYDS